MAKKYSFEFSGTKETFLNQLKEFPNNNQKFFYFDNYIVELLNDEIRFGVQGGHSGGYWFVPTITECDNKVLFCGTIQYIDAYTNEKGIKKIINSIEEIFLFIILLPVIVALKLWFFFSRLVQKISKHTKPEAETTEDKLYKLMENSLNCKRK